MTKIREGLFHRSHRIPETEIDEAKKYTSTRTEVLDQLQSQAAQGIIRLHRGDGRRARERVLQKGREYNSARRELLHHELATHYRVMVSGSARINPNSPEYQFTTELTHELVKELGVDIINGAGPGIMGAAALGARRAREDALPGNINSRTLGVSIRLPYEEAADPNLDSYHEHTEYTTRIQEMIDMSHAAYFGPGGIGTALELIMVMQLKQSHHLEPEYPIIVHPFWKKTIEDFHKMMYEERIKQGVDPLIRFDDLQVRYAATVPEIVGIIRQGYEYWDKTIGQHTRRR
ncbi:MAG TPA: LOG family protein [Patescibacteria group bacterium]|nr:LOG family protein [Patescibacteria group bacterium]